LPHRARNKGSNRSHTWLLLWIAFILVITVPWYALDPDPRFYRIRWIPFLSRPRSIRDILLNVGLYVPFGYLLLRQLAGKPHSVWKVVAAALALSSLSEASQLFSRGRFPSSTDLVTNGAGAWLGALWARSRQRRFRGGPRDHVE
jgi:glycopeptide antibiotics resistance protein